MRTDTSTTNFSNQEYVTKAYASTLIGSNLASVDTSSMNIANNGIMTVTNGIDTSKKLNVISSSVGGSIYPEGGSFLSLKGLPDTSSVGGALTLYNAAQASGLHATFRRATGYDFAEPILYANQFASKSYAD